MLLNFDFPYSITYKKGYYNTDIRNDGQVHKVQKSKLHQYIIILL